MGSHPQHIMALNTGGVFFDSYISIRLNFDVCLAQRTLQGISML